MTGDTLCELYHEAWSLLRQGAAGANGFRTTVLASVTGDGLPDARTVVLRQVDEETRRLAVNTDRRSTKFAELAAHPYGRFVFFDPALQVQLRILAAIALHENDLVSRAAWEALTPDQQANYRTAAPPGTPTAAPEAEARDPGEPDEEGAANLAVVAATALELDVLVLGPARRRAEFSWNGEGQPNARWLVP